MNEPPRARRSPRAWLAAPLAALAAACGAEEPFQARFTVRGRWAGEREVAYRVDPAGGALDSATFRRALEGALAGWAETGCATFREAREGEEPALAFSWARGEHEGCVAFGADPSVAHAGPVGPGTFVHFDAEREWDEAALERAALHEVGHVLGLGHSDDERAIMHSQPSPARSRIGASDLAGLRSLYGSADGGGAITDSDGDGDLLVLDARGEVALVLSGVAPSGASAWWLSDLDRDGASELLVRRTDEAGHGATFQYRFGPGPALELASGPRYGGAAPSARVLGPAQRADLDGDGALELVRRAE